MVGMSGARSPYRMRAENLLPKFESPKNPFAPALKTEVAKADCSTVAADASPSAVKVAPMETYPLFDNDLKPLAVASKPAEKLSEAKIAAPISEPVLEFPSRITPVMTETVEEIIPIKVIEQPIVHQRRLMQPEPKGLVDGSPLGLKTGTPSRAPLPAPVVAPPKNEGKQSTPSTPGEASSSSSEKSQCVVSSAPAKAQQASGLFATVKNFFRSGSRSTAANQRKPVQTELSLDRVKVMRNDLSDADLEVVSKTPEKPVVHAVRLPAFVAESGGIGRMASRIFGVGESLVR